MDDGELLFNDREIPLIAQGDGMDLAVDYSDVLGRRTYAGQFTWQRMELAARRYLPFASDIAVRFTLEPDALNVTQLVWTGPHTFLDAQFSLLSFVHPAWTFRYRGRLDFQDIRTLLRKPTTPDGQVEFNGDGHFATARSPYPAAIRPKRLPCTLTGFIPGESPRAERIIRTGTCSCRRIFRRTRWAGWSTDASSWTPRAVISRGCARPRRRPGHRDCGGQ